MEWFVSNIVWDTDGKVVNLPPYAFISWEHGVNTVEDAIDHVAEQYGFLILSCDTNED